MKKTLTLVVVFFAMCFAAQPLKAEQRTLLNLDWRFAKGHAANPAEDFNYGQALSFSKIAFIQESTMLLADQQSRLSIPHTQRFKDEDWEKIDVPHDWGMQAEYGKDQFKVKGYRKLGGRSPENSVGWYRKSFNVDGSDKGNRFYLEFEGIFRDAQVWMNGIYLGRHESGYTGFMFDVTECLNYGEENVVSVRVDATHSELWSYEGAGIYRNVWLIKTAPVHVPMYGTFVTYKVGNEGGKAVVKTQTEVKNTTFSSVAANLRSTIKDAEGKTVATKVTPVNIPGLETAVVTPEVIVNDAKVWSLENPVLYKLISEVIIDGDVVDTYETRFGMRNIHFDANQGFFLNGKHVQVQGVCCHQDHAGVGIAVPDELNYWRVKRLKDYGTNAYRASHNPPTKAVLDACDSLGMLAMDELRVLSSSDEGLTQLEYLIRRDRNHPSVFIWCLGNEEPAIQGNEKGKDIVTRMIGVQRKLDPTRLSTAAMNGSWGEGFSLAVDVQGSNYYKIGNLDDVHKKLPNLPVLLTEEASTLTTRGEYETVAEKGFHQSYDRDYPGWGSSAQEWMRYVAERPYIGGGFVWTGFDYGGESIAHYWPGVVSHFGILDYCGFAKDAFWYYKAWWTDEPVLHILPHWNREGLPSDSVEVNIYSNMDQVELFLNGKSLGKKKLGKYDIASYNVKYQPGKLEAKGVRDGKKYNAVVETTGEATELRLSAMNKGTIRGDRNDVAIVQVEVLDSKGRLVPTASDKINFKAENGVIIGVGNGHPSSHEPDNFGYTDAAYRNAFHGLAQVIVKSDGSGRPIVLTARSADLAGAEMKINLK